jgi:hypothetical protein
LQSDPLAPRPPKEALAARPSSPRLRDHQARGSRPLDDKARRSAFLRPTLARATRVLPSNSLPHSATIGFDVANECVGEVFAHGAKVGPCMDARRRHGRPRGRDDGRVDRYAPTCSPGRHARELDATRTLSDDEAIRLDGPRAVCRPLRREGINDRYGGSDKVIDMARDGRVSPCTLAVPANKHSRPRPRRRESPA